MVKHNQTNSSAFAASENSEKISFSQITEYNDKTTFINFQTVHKWLITFFGAKDSSPRQNDRNKPTCP